MQSETLEKLYENANKYYEQLKNVYEIKSRFDKLTTDVNLMMKILKVILLKLIN